MGVLWYYSFRKYASNAAFSSSFMNPLSMSVPFVVVEVRGSFADSMQISDIQHAQVSNLTSEWGRRVQPSNSCMTKDWAASETEFKRALNLNPNYANAHIWYAQSLLWMQRPDDAVDEGRRARDLDPLSLLINANLGFILGVTRHYDLGI